MFQDYSVFRTQSVNNPNVNLTVSVIALVANVAAFAYILYRARKLKVNPYPVSYTHLATPSPPFEPPRMALRSFRHQGD